MKQRFSGNNLESIIIGHLCNILLLGDIPPEMMADLKEIAAQCSIETFNVGDVLMLEDDRSHCMYLILSGRVNVLKGYGSFDEVVIAVRGTDEVIGEMGIDNKSPRFASVVAIEPLETIVIPYTALGQNAIKWRFVWVANSKLREAQEKRYAEMMRYQKELGGLASLQKSFLDVVRHEMMTPVSKAIMVASLLKEIDPNSDSFEEMLTILDSVLKDTKRLIETMLNYVDMSDLAWSDNEHYRRIGFNSLIDVAVENQQAWSKINRINIEVFNALEVLWVHGDAQALTMAADHLLHNAIKATAKTSDHGVVQVSVWEEDDRAYFLVRDNGEGLLPEQLEILWKPFQQDADVLKRGVEKGLGLGLAITKRIVLNHGGDVFVKSTEGEGSTFGFWIPVNNSLGRFGINW